MVELRLLEVVLVSPPAGGCQTSSGEDFQFGGAFLAVRSVLGPHGGLAFAFRS